MQQAKGDFIGGRFVAPQGDTLVSRNPAQAGQPVLETAWDAVRVAQACEAAASAQAAWQAMGLSGRWRALLRFRDAISAHAEALAEAITLEMGKLRSEARIEVKALVGRFGLVHGQIASDLRSGPLPGFPDEELHYSPHGVVGVIGPFNFPLHLCHAHVVPALLTGNTVVIKPSEVTPLCGQRYAEAALAAGLPPGVVNVVNGGGMAGAALVSDPRVRGLCFTGSYGTGRRITQAALDRPELLVALEMGGKNTTIVLDDADIRHAAHDIVVGGYLTTGQRCTCTDRVLVQRAVMPALIDALRPLVASLRFGHPDVAGHFAGPLATEQSLKHFEAAVAAGEAAGAEVLVRGDRPEGGFFAAPSLHLLPDGLHDVPGYTDEELFGPDLHLEIIEDEAEAVSVLNASPFGLANSVFTAHRARFEAIHANTRVGILNWNRTTNQASPRLPFGGVGQSGNFRPAGAHAARNTVIPVAVKTAQPGDFEPHALLRDHLISPDLGALEAQHAAEEAAEAARVRTGTLRPLRAHFPKGGHMPESERWLKRLYTRGRMAKEKKPLVYDHLRAWGPWMASIDDQPLVVIDGMSQTATLTSGFAPDAVASALVEGEFGDTTLDGGDITFGEHPAARAFADKLRDQLPALPHVTFVNSGAESNEKAFALCRLNAPNPDADRVLVFEGGFHGRTMLALHSTWNPVKRQPFEIAGYASVFAPFPLWTTPMEAEPEVPEGFLASAASGDVAALLEAHGEGDDALLAAEVASLAKVHEALSSGRIFAVSVEPMQSEGGDRYATARFFRALRLLTRHHGVGLIMDEVQTGFGLGGPLFWHTAFGMVDADGAPDHPDVVIVAKRAQVGVVMSVWPDPEPTATQAASLVRGRLHLEMMLAASDDHRRVQGLVWPRLQEMARRYPHLVHNPRCRGFAFAFDLPASEHLAPFYLQRFWRGVVVFGAGTRTVRYRLSTAFTESNIDQIFTAIRRSLSWLDAHPGQKPPAWEDPWVPQAAAADEAPETRVRVAEGAEVDTLLPAIQALEAEVYEPARRDPAELLRLAFDDPHGVAAIAEAHTDEGWVMAGYAVGAPLERVRTTDGPSQDPMLDRHNTLYSLALSVSPRFQGLGLGKALKAAQLGAAAAMSDDAGQPRYHYITGRNRLGFADTMVHLNQRFGAHTVKVYEQQYGDPDGKALYYRQPIRRLLAASAPERSAQGEVANLASGVASPFGAPPASLVAAERAGLLSGPAVSKITICNYITPAVVRAIEYASALIPTHPHVYLTSGRDEGVDKAIRTLRYSRKSASVAIGFEGGYVGHTSSGARSVSDPATHRQGPPYFQWPRVPHPAEVGAEASLTAIKEAIQAAGGPEGVLGLFLEPVQERTGRVAPAAFWEGLEALRREHDLPLALFESASAGWRGDAAHPFAFQGLGLSPDIVAWWGGGQTGFVHLTGRYFISKPLMMVSTWDGDELSMIRLHHQLRAVRQLDQSEALAAMAEVAEAVAAAGFSSAGSGLYRVINAGDGASAEALAAALKAQGVLVYPFPNGHLGVAPRFDSAAADLRRLAVALRGQGEASS